MYFGLVLFILLACFVLFLITISENCHWSVCSTFFILFFTIFMWSEIAINSGHFSKQFVDIQTVTINRKDVHIIDAFDKIVIAETKFKNVDLTKTVQVEKIVGWSYGIYFDESYNYRYKDDNE